MRIHTVLSRVGIWYVYMSYLHPALGEVHLRVILPVALLPVLLFMWSSTTGRPQIQNENATHTC